MSRCLTINKQSFQKNQIENVQLYVLIASLKASPASGKFIIIAR